MVWDMASSARIGDRGRARTKSAGRRAPACAARPRARRSRGAPFRAPASSRAPASRSAASARTAARRRGRSRCPARRCRRRAAGPATEPTSLRRRAEVAGGRVDGVVGVVDGDAAVAVAVRRVRLPCRAARGRPRTAGPARAASGGVEARMDARCVASPVARTRSRRPRRAAASSPRSARPRRDRRRGTRAGSRPPPGTRRGEGPRVRSRVRRGGGLAARRGAAATTPRSAAARIDAAPRGGGAGARGRTTSAGCIGRREVRAGAAPTATRRRADPPLIASRRAQDALAPDPVESR